MSTDSRTSSKAQEWAEIVDWLRSRVPHVSSWWDRDEEFQEIRIMARPDGTSLAVAKGFGPDGGPVVCFGSGYGVIGALMAIDATIQSGRWRTDVPWEERGKPKGSNSR